MGLQCRRVCSTLRLRRRTPTPASTQSQSVPIDLRFDGCTVLKYTCSIAIHPAALGSTGVYRGMRTKQCASVRTLAYMLLFCLFGLIHIYHLGIPTSRSSRGSATAVRYISHDRPVLCSLLTGLSRISARAAGGVHRTFDVIAMVIASRLRSTRSLLHPTVKAVASGT
jgi:hypothetical protein